MEEFATEHFWIALPMALILCIVAMYLAYRCNYFSLPRPSKTHTVAFKHLAGAFGTYFVLTLIFYPLMVMFTKKTPQVTPHVATGPSAWIQLIYIVILFIAIYGYLFALKKEVMRAIFFDGLPNRFKAVLKGLGVGLVSWCIAYPSVLLINLITGEIGKWIWGENKIDQVAVKHLKGMSSRPVIYSLMVICVILIVPMIEELLFRGFLQSWLRRYLGRIGSLFITALIFAFVHYSPVQGAVNFELICSLFVLSCFLGFVYEREKTLWAPIGLHAIFNGITVLFLTLQQQ